MNRNKIIYAAIEAFKQKFSTFCINQSNILDNCSSETFTKFSKGLLEALQSAGKAGIEEYLQQNDIKASGITIRNRYFRFKGMSEKELLTLFGTVTINRTFYYDEKNGGEYFVPLDHSIGLEKNDFATLETREMILFASANCVPTELSALLGKCSLCTPAASTIQRIINKDGRKMEELREQLADGVFKNQQIPSQAQAVVVSLDGANVLIREPGEKKGRKNQRPVPGDNNTHQSSTSYHNAMVGAVSFYGKDQESKPDRISSLYMARMPEEKSTTFKNEFEQVLKLFEPEIEEKSIPKILLTDGHLMIKGFAKGSEILKPYEKAIDFYHTTEHLSKAADAMYGDDTDASKWWYNKWRDELKNNPEAPQSIIRSMVGFASRTTLSDKRKKELKTEITFFRKNKYLMKYSDFIKRGLPIGSGPIEAAAKTIVKQRMCRSGMSWSREKGQFILTIKAYVQSGLWDNFWENYKSLKKAA